jgi:hypothetical protein
MKMFEVRDRGTYIPVLAMKMQNEPVEQDLKVDAAYRYHLGQTGYGPDSEFPVVVVMRLDDCQAHYDQFKWSNSSRTMQIAHEYIADHFDELKDCAVVDVEFISGESLASKESQVPHYYL